ALLCPKRPESAVLVDFLISPAMVSLAWTELDIGDTCGRIVLPHTRNCRTQQAPDGRKPMAFCGRLRNAGQHFLDVLLPQQRDPLIAVLYPKPFDYPTMGPFRVGAKQLPFGRIEVGDN